MNVIPLLSHRFELTPADTTPERTDQVQQRLQTLTREIEQRCSRSMPHDERWLEDLMR